MKRYNIKVNGSLYEVEVEEIMGSQSTEKSKKSNPPVKQSPTNVHEAVRLATGPGSDNFGKSAAAQASLGTSAGQITVSAPMPGTVMDVRVTDGQHVEAGDILIILEAMKMENEILAPGAGTVASVAIGKGATVNAGDLLIEIDGE